MSCTVIAVPYALAWIVGTVVASSAAAVAAKNESNNSSAKYANRDIINLITN